MNVIHSKLIFKDKVMQTIPNFQLFFDKLRQSNVQTQPPHTEFGEKGAVGTKEEIEQYLKHRNVEDNKSYCLMQVSQLNDIEAFIEMLQTLHEEIAKKSTDHLLPLEMSEMKRGESPIKEEITPSEQFEMLLSDNQSEEAIKYLQANKDRIDVNFDGGLPILRAVENKDLTMVKLLLEQGADVNLFDALEMAAYQGDAQCAEILIDHLPSNEDVREIRTSTAYTNYPHIKALIDHKIQAKYGM
jgi:ankyrin repeat protein